jgi:predicted esterase
MYKLLLLCSLLMGQAMLSAEDYILTGKIMDTDDNWLNEAKITLSPLKIETHTNANGEFSLKFTLDEPLTSTKRKFIASLKVERAGHVEKSIRIRSMSYFSKSIEVKLSPQAVDSSVLGFTVQMDPTNSIIGKRTGRDADFYIFIPETVKKIRAALYISMHGMGDITKPILKKFAEDEQLALVAMNGDPIKRGINNVELINEHIQKLAELSGHPELTTAPIMTFGHSNGTGFAASFPRDWHERTIAWVAFHPGYSGYLQFPNTEKVPAMVMCGTIDKYLLNARQDEIVADLRKEKNAAMNVMMEGGVGHGPADQDATWIFIRDFLKAAMDSRLNQDGTLKPVVIEQGWLGARYDLEKGGRQNLVIAAYLEFKGDKATANWFPNEAFAKAWQAYGKLDPKK